MLYRKGGSSGMLSFYPFQEFLAVVVDDGLCGFDSRHPVAVFDDVHFFDWAWRGGVFGPCDALADDGVDAHSVGDCASASESSECFAL